jgi:hypothetical protein
VQSLSAVPRMACLVLCLLVGFPQRCWLRHRIGLMCSEEASDRPQARIVDVLLGCAAETGRRATLNSSGFWQMQVRGWMLLATCSAERWSALSMRHSGRAVERCFFPLGVSTLVVRSWCIPLWWAMNGHSQPTNQRSEGGDLREALGDVPRSV